MAYDRQDLENIISESLRLLNDGDIDASRKLLSDTHEEINRLYDTDRIYRNSGVR